MLSLSDKKFRWGIIGPGRIAEQFALALKVVEGACLYAVASNSMHRAQRFASDHSASVYYDNYAALIEDPNVDAIYIATPHRFHYQQARECLMARKPVLCEKPLTVNALEAEGLMRLSQENGVFLMEAMWTRFLPIYQEIKQWLDAGKIGPVTSITSSFGFELPRDSMDRMQNHELAGGVLLDMGVYSLSMSQWIFVDPPESFSIRGYLGGTDVDEHDKTLITYSGGRSSVFTSSMLKELNNNLTISGERGRIYVDAMFWSATKATLFVDGDAEGESEVCSVTREFRATGLEYEIEEAMRCIGRGDIESQHMPMSDTLATMKLLDQLRASIGLTYTFEESPPKVTTPSKT
jgi:predicted dehydrogenase